MKQYMMPLFLVGALVALPSAAWPQSNVRQTPGSQIQVTYCYPHVHTEAQHHPWIDVWGRWHPGPYFPYWDAFLAISYRNTAPVAATEVDFGLVARGILVAVARDIGTFSPGVLIQGHEFQIARDVFPLGTEFPYCAVMRVKYADGSAWDNPNPPLP